MPEFDPHTHSIASGHATSCTITDMAKKAVSLGLKMIGITDHGPATPYSCLPSYFRNLSFSPRERLGIEIMIGAELNLLDNSGSVDLDHDILKHLDYAIVSMHPQTFKPGTAAANTAAYIRSMKHPNVKILGHCDDSRFPVDYDTLVKAAKERRVLLEINNSSLRPDGYRGNARPNILSILECCARYSHPVVLSSDSHGTEHIGDFCLAASLIEETAFPQSLVLNNSLEAFRSFLNESYKGGYDHADD